MAIPSQPGRRNGNVLAIHGEFGEDEAPLRRSPPGVTIKPMHVYAHYFSEVAPSTLVFSALAAGFAALRLLWQSRWQNVLSAMESRQFWLPAAVILLGGYVVLLALTTSYPGFIDHVEPNIVAVSALASRGEPLYHGAEAAQRYSLLYGPMTYLPYMWALRYLGLHIWSAKLVVLIGNLGMLALLWSSYRRRLGTQRALFAAVMVIAFMLAGEPYLLETRGDIVMIVAAAIGLAGAVSGTAWLAGLLLAVGIGISVATKITGFFYFLPLLAMLYRRFGARTTAVTLLGAAAVVCLAFAPREVTATNYWTWLGHALHHPLNGHTFIRNLKVLAMLSTPLFVLGWRLYERDRRALREYVRREGIALAGLVVAIGLMTIVASKLGAGEHHYLPFYPWLGYMCCELYGLAETTREPARSSLRITVSVLCCLWLVAIAGTRIAWGISLIAPYEVSGRQTAAAVSKELREIMREHPGEKIEMGYGETWERTNALTYFRPLLVFAGNPFTIDEAAQNDMVLSRVSMPESTIAYVDSCQTQIWLIPRGERPFMLPTIYLGVENLPSLDIFGDEFRSAFAEHYRVVESDKYFDVWSCEGKKGG